MSDRYCWISYSKDGGHNLTEPTQHSLGELGDFQKRVQRWRMGYGRDWVFRISISSPIKRDLLAASIQAESER